MSNETTLDEFVDFFFKERYLKPTDYRFVSSTNTKLIDMPAREFILYDYNKDKILGTESTLKVMRVLAFDNRTGNGYSIKYASQPGQFNKYLPAAQKMIGSFKTGVENLDINMPVTSSNNVQSIITPPVQNTESQGPENKFILKWGSPGTGNGQFHEPADLAVDSSSGLVYVADLLNNRIQKFDTEGRYLSQWGSYGSADGQFSHPGDVAVSPWGEIFVVDIDNARIEKFDSNATFVSKWGIFGTEDGQFNHPGDIAFDSTNRSIFVVDTDNNRIQKFDSNGTFISKWGSLGTQDGQFNQPAGIAFDDVNKILYVADTKNDRVQKFDSNGTFISKWGSTWYCKWRT